MTSNAFNVKRYCGDSEEGLTTLVKAFQNKTDCVNWINSLKFADVDSFYPYPNHATIHNLTVQRFPISFDEPEFSSVADKYNLQCDECIFLQVLTA